MEKKITKNLPDTQANDLLASELDAALKEYGQKIIKSGGVLKGALNLSDEQVERLYAEGYRLYNSGKYLEATHIFRTLILVNNMEIKYSLGLAACFHMLGEYENAIQIYGACITLDPLSPVPHYHMADCYMQTKQNLAALLSLEMVVAKSTNFPSYQVIKERAALAIESLKEQLQPSKR